MTVFTIRGPAKRKTDLTPRHGGVRRRTAAGAATMAAAVALTRARQGRGHGAAQTLEDVGDNAGDECPQPIGQSG